MESISEHFVSECDALLRSGAERFEDVQQYFVDAIWKALRREIPVARLAELLSHTMVPRKDFYQRLLADAVWLVGFAATEQPPDKGMKHELESLCLQLSAHNVVSKPILALASEIESLPQSVCQVAILRKKHNQARTKARYTIQRYNLLREHNEGYARMLFLLDRLAGCDSIPPASKDELEQTQVYIIDSVFRLIGFSNLCPNRVLCMAVDIFEHRLGEAETQVRMQPLLALLRRFPSRRVTEAVVFQLLAHATPPAATVTRQASVTPHVDLSSPPSRPAQFLAVAALVAHGLVDLDALWPYLEPKDKDLRESYTDLVAKYDAELDRTTKIDLGSNSGATEKEKNAFSSLFQDFNAAKHPKFRLAAALISVNAWQQAHRVLLNLQQFCKPCLNDGIRSALCDLLKWLLGPVLRPTHKKLPHQTKSTLETTFKGTRRFNLGLGVAVSGPSLSPAASKDAVAPLHAAKGEGPLALRPSAELDQLIPQVKLVLEHLEYFLHTDLHLLTSLWRLQLLTLMQREKSSGAGVAVLDDGLVSMVYRHLLPAACLVQHNPNLSDLMWSVIGKLSVYQRFLIYSCWETMYDQFLLKLAHDKTKMAAKQILKRVVANAERRDLVAHQSHFHFCKLCHSNPLPALETMLKDVEIGFNVNMIQPYVECTNKCPDMTADVMAFVLTRSCSKPVTIQRPMLNQADATLSAWLTNIGEFAGRFYKKHPATDLVGLLMAIAKRISSELEDKEKRSPGEPPFEYKGESLIRVILENLIEFMGGYTTVADMNADQLICLAGGPRLQCASISAGKQEDGKSKERARSALFNAIVELGLVRVLWNSLSQQRHHFLSEDFSEAHSGSSGLKLLTLLFDGNHTCFLTLTEFLAQACPKDKYAALLPPISDVFMMFEPALAFHAVRHGLTPYGRPTADVEIGTPTAAESTPGIECDMGVEMVQVINSYIPRRKFESDGISMQFYITFWRLSLQDIVLPTEGYEKATAQISQTLNKHDLAKKQMERQVRDQTRSREYKTLKKEVARLTDFQARLKDEQLQQKRNYERVIARLEREKRNWFMKPSPQATAAFVHEMVYARVLVSYSDALFCSSFVKLLIKLKTPGFHLLDFYNSWTIMLTQCLKSCSEREARVFGVFLREMMRYILYLRKDESTFQAEMIDNPAFYRNYRDEPSKGAAPSAIEWANFTDIRKGHSKWEGRIFKVMRQSLEADDWMEKRNALLLLSQAYEAFPMVEKYASLVLQSVTGMQEKEESGDLKTLASSLTMKLRAQQERWVDKAAATPPQTSRKPKEASASQVDVASANTTKDSAASVLSHAANSSTAARVDPRDRDRDRQRDRDRDRHGERPSPANGGANTASSAGAQISVVPATMEKRIVTEQELLGERRNRREDEDVRELDRKRSVTNPAPPQSSTALHAVCGSGDRRGDAGTSQHDDRAEKRRRQEKDAGSSARGDTRGADRKRSSLHNAAPPQSGAMLHAANGSNDRRSDTGPPQHDDRAEKRRRAEREGAGSGHRGSASNTGHSSRGVDGHRCPSGGTAEKRRHRAGSR